MKTKNEKFSQQNISFPHGDFKIIIGGGKSRAFDKAFHEEIEIKYFYEGVSTLMIDKNVIVAKPGDVTIVNPFELHANVEIGQTQGKYISIILSIDFLKELNPNGLDLRRALILKGVKFYNHVSNNERLQTIIKRAYDEITEEKENYRLVVYGLITEFFAILLRDYVNAEKPTYNAETYTKRAEVISPALSKIFKDYNEKITVEELAKLCNVSKYYFCRLFKEETGLSVIQYIISYRISIAETMLKSTDNSVESVAYLCGFDDVSYFYRTYKKLKGVSPMKARKQ